MPKIKLQTNIAAPPQRCFDLSRSIDLHMLSTAKTGEKAIAGVMTGLIGMGESVTWRAKHFGIWFQLTSKITAYNYPYSFTDEMQKGVFRSIYHRHDFEAFGSMTIMYDLFQFRTPLGPLGKLANWIFLKAYMTRFLKERNEVIKKWAESGEDFENRIIKR